MNIYGAFEWLVIALLLAVSLRVVWLKVLKPTLQRPKAACGGGCTQCAAPTKP